MTLARDSLPSDYDLSHRRLSIGHGIVAGLALAPSEDLSSGVPLAIESALTGLKAFPAPSNNPNLQPNKGKEHKSKSHHRQNSVEIPPDWARMAEKQNNSQQNATENKCTNNAEFDTRRDWLAEA